MGDGRARGGAPGTTGTHRTGLAPTAIHQHPWYPAAPTGTGLAPTSIHRYPEAPTGTGPAPTSIHRYPWYPVAPTNTRLAPTGIRRHPWVGSTLAPGYLVLFRGWKLGSWLATELRGLREALPCSAVCQIRATSKDS
ncbi:hypothetical protein llap_18815 [Limosa lapponica baueri]|uniref:Uncharacterized protein n=1 Tax=Limosa lapponica baueri TaxID=1758121 RepID=A0A2I0TAQ8_LIMLA|nr:hypothetical protein llap_18815 [Limosa lapponica baueri]